MFKPRVSEFPACKAAASGWKDGFAGVLDFMGAWVNGEETGSPFVNPDFLCFDAPMKFMWMVLLPDGETDARGFELTDFSGGLYVSAIAINDDTDDLLKTIDNLLNWVNGQANFEADFRPGRYRMTRRFTTDASVETWERSLGYGQLEVFIPVRVTG